NKRAIVVVAAVLVIGIIVGIGCWAISNVFAPTGGDGPVINKPAPDPLLTVDDMAGLGVGEWLVSPEVPTAANALCIGATYETAPLADRIATRQLNTAGNPANTVANLVATYATLQIAGQVLADQVSQMGICPGVTAQLVNSYDIAGLGDEFSAFTLMLETDVLEYHTIFLGRTGRVNIFVDLVDSQKAIAPAEASGMLVKVLNRLCRGGEGACPTGISVNATVPPVGDFAGWLTEVDMPRINANAGAWGASEPSSTLKITGSQCEVGDLKKVSGAKALQRTLLLVGDPKAPKSFGVDQVDYTFDDPDKAAKYAKELNRGLANCADTRPTAAVEEGANIKGVGAGDAAFTGKTYQITHTISVDSSTVYRVAVITSGSSVGYLFANPSANFNFSDQQWKAIATRAAERITQK
ncbi:MAG: hypothetical protein LBU38_06080, partial [Propionibacteriaceae bacterium]|nr:hypothetical protein [Propionibacteriaceae bacterium]